MVCMIPPNWMILFLKNEGNKFPYKRGAVRDRLETQLQKHNQIGCVRHEKQKVEMETVNPLPRDTKALGKQLPDRGEDPMSPCPTPCQQSADWWENLPGESRIPRLHCQPHRWSDITIPLMSSWCSGIWTKIYGRKGCFDHRVFTEILWH